MKEIIRGYDSSHLFREDTLERIKASGEIIQCIERFKRLEQQTDGVQRTTIPTANKAT